MDATCRCDEELAARCLLQRRDVTPRMGGVVGVNRTVELHDVGLHFELLDHLDRVLLCQVPATVTVGSDPPQH